VIGTVHRCAVERQVFFANHPKSNAAERARQANAAVTERVKVTLPAKDQGEQHAGRPNDQDIQGNQQVGRGGPDDGYQHRRAEF
jgi:hypothetical protein